MKNIAIIQLTRTGDILQTCQAMASVRNENPDVKFTLIAREKFGKSIEFIAQHLFDNIIYLDTKFFFNQSKTLANVQENLSSYLSEINQYNFDVVINLSFNKSSEYLASLIQSPHKIGLYRDQFNQINMTDSWSQYVFSTTMQNHFNPFNLIDIYRKMIGGRAVNNIIYDKKSSNSKIVIHPFASQKRKTWGHDQWGELIYKLLRKYPDHEIHIVGAQSDQEIAEKILGNPALKNYLSRIISQINKANIEQCCELLKESDLFIGHDSMVSHLAAMTQTPSIIIALGNVRPYETAPYSNNSLIVAPRISCFSCFPDTPCELYPCHSYISFNNIEILANALLKKIEITSQYLHLHIPIFEVDKINIYQSNIHQDLGLELVEVLHDESSSSDVFRVFYKILWSLILSDQEVKISNIPRLTRNNLRLLRNISDGLTYYFELTEFGIKYSNFIIDEAEKNQPSMDKIKEFANKIDEIDEMCSSVSTSFKELAPLVNYFYVKRNNIQDSQITKVAKQSLLIFHEANNASSIMFELISQTLLANDYSISPVIDTKNPQGEA